MALAPFCCSPEWEKEVGVRSGGGVSSGDGGEEEDGRNVGLTGSAKALCVPFEQPEMPDGQLCFVSGEVAKKWVLFGRSY
jgi:hypothetical protein